MTLTQSDTPLFRLEHVALKKKIRYILRDINLTIQRGEFVVFLGPSGAGKTSLLRLFNLLELPTEGRIFFKGENVLQLHIPDFRQRVVLVLQKPFLLEGTVRDNVIAGLVLRHREIPPENQLKELLQRCGLPGEMLTERADHLSGGEQQRLSLARALALNPEVLLLDEPTASLDVESERRLIETILKENKTAGRTVLTVTHSLPLIQQASRLVFLDGGRIVSVRDSASDDEIRTFLKEALDGKNNH